MNGCADDLATLINELSLGQAIVVGYSMGGAIAQVLAKRHRDVVRGLVLCATAASFAKRVKLRPAVTVAGTLGGSAARMWPDTARRFLNWRIARHDIKVERQSQGRIEKYLGTKLGRCSMARAKASCPDRAHECEEPRLRWSGRWPNGRCQTWPAFIEAGAALNAYDSSRWLPQLDVPTAVIITTGDEVVARRRQEKMAALIPRARRYPVEGGHDAVVARPDVFLPILRDACIAERGTAVGHGPEAARDTSPTNYRRSLARRPPVSTRTRASLSQSRRHLLGRRHDLRGVAFAGRARRPLDRARDRNCRHHRPVQVNRRAH